MRWGASNSTTVRDSPASSRRRRRRSPARCGRKPSNTKRSPGRPLTLISAATAEGPGSGLTGIPASSAARTNRAPGSETPGVPPSETSARLSPSRNRPSSRSSLRLSLNLWQETVGVSRPYRANSRRVRRVSSQAITSTLPSTSSARGDRSSTFPSGVATTYSCPGTAGLSFSSLAGSGSPNRSSAARPWR